MAENDCQGEDLIQRLRDIARHRAKTNEHGGSSPEVMTEWLAADEIVRLRDENSRLVEALDSDEFLSLTQERDRLREALAPFATLAGSYDPDEGDSDQLAWGNNTTTIGDLRRARAALNKEPPCQET